MIQNRKQSGKKISKWLWFGLVYGNLNALVAGIVLSLLWTQKASGKATCEKVFLDIVNCRVSIILLVIFVFGTSTVLSVARFRQAAGVSDDKE